MASRRPPVVLSAVPEPVPVDWRRRRRWATYAGLVTIDPRGEPPPGFARYTARIKELDRTIDDQSFVEECREIAVSTGTVRNFDDVIARYGRKS